MLSVLWLVPGCGDDDKAITPDAGGLPDAGTPDPTPDAGRMDAGAMDAGSDAGTDAGMPDGGEPPTVEKDVRFIAIGDTGTGEEGQYQVAEAMRTVCAAKGCDFVLMLGDNIYEAGVDGFDDPQWTSKFEEPYADMDMPFYVALGNHDYGGHITFPFQATIDGYGNEFHKGLFEVDYTEYSDKWTMPDTHYTYQVGHVGFVMLDTNSLIWDDDTHGDQWAWYDGAVADLRADGAEIIIAAGHHPYLSNGSHGNAGSYEAPEIAGIEIPLPAVVPIIGGTNVKRFFDEHVCGTVDVYFSGHDHTRQWMNEPDALCGAELIVSGAGGKLKSLRSTINTTHYEDATSMGFMYVHIEEDQMTGQFYDAWANVNFEQVVTLGAQL